jgi:glycosyltransferase involved in cell wall biosynthesis
MKIAVYTIALNEEKHVLRWHESAKDADILIIADTGSTDKTRSLARSLGIEVTQIDVNPWRFDIARNASLALIPEDFDICIQLDMDEVLPPGWRAKVEDAFKAGNVWPIYKHVTSRDENRVARTYQNYFKIHPRKGFYWKYPIHEVILCSEPSPPRRDVIDLEVEHLQDLSKERTSYLPLLELAVREMPNDWRMNHYLNREYFNRRDWLAVLRSAYQTVSIPGGWDIERASTCMWASEASNNLGLNELAIEWARKATEAAPKFYEAWHWRAHVAHLNQNWEECFTFASKIHETSRQEHHLVRASVWEWWGNDLIALASSKLGNYKNAVHYGQLALWANPKAPRLLKNLDFYRSQADAESRANLKPLTISEKLIGFPTIYVINLERAVKRREALNAIFAKVALTNIRWIEATYAQDRSEPGVQQAIFESHQMAIRTFLEGSNLEWVVICEDDIQFDLVDNWNFSWSEKFSELERLGVDIFQMCLITKDPEKLDTRMHPRRVGFDWCSAAYLISRKGAAEILSKSTTQGDSCESNLFDGLAVKSEALLLCSTDFEDSVHLRHMKMAEESFGKSNLEMRNRGMPVK